MNFTESHQYTILVEQSKFPHLYRKNIIMDATRQMSDT